MRPDDFCMGGSKSQDCKWATRVNEGTPQAGGVSFDGCGGRGLVPGFAAITVSYQLIPPSLPAGFRAWEVNGRQHNWWAWVATEGQRGWSHRGGDTLGGVGVTTEAPRGFASCYGFGSCMTATTATDNSLPVPGCAGKEYDWQSLPQLASVHHNIV